jgi:hypothetical protein
MKNTEDGRPKPCGKLDISGTAATVNTSSNLKLPVLSLNTKHMQAYYH